MDEKKGGFFSLSRYSQSFLILILYALPVLTISGWAQKSSAGWEILGIGLFFSAFGTFIFFLILQKKISPSLIKEEDSPVEHEAEVRQEEAGVDFSPYLEQIESQKNALKEAEQSYKLLSDQYENMTEEYRKVVAEKERIGQQAENQQHEYKLFKNHAQEQNDYYHELLEEHQRTIAELRDSLEKKQQHIQQLESKTRDMNYEIKTLLQLAEKPVSNFESSIIPLHPQKTPLSPPPAQSRWETGEPNILDFAVRTHEEAHVHLKRLLDLAQRITGTSLFSSSPRFKELPLENYTLDLRSLFDRLKEINASTIIVYSMKENKLLFVNDQIKELLGINPDKFVHQFQETLQMGQADWQDAIRQLSFKNEARTTLLLKARSGQEISVECMLGIVPTGIFRNHIIGLLYKLYLSTSNKIHKL